MKASPIEIIIKGFKVAIIAAVIYAATLLVNKGEPATCYYEHDTETVSTCVHNPRTYMESFYLPFFGDTVFFHMVLPEGYRSGDSIAFHIHTVPYSDTVIYRVLDMHIKMTP